MNGDLKLLAELVSRMSDDEADKLIDFIRAFRADSEDTERNQEPYQALSDPA